jgi:hypothetical protein
LLLMAGSRVVDLRSDKEPDQPVRFVRPHVSILATLRWLADQPAVSTMIFVGVLSGVANIVLQTLAPRYVVAALHVDAANAVYVFAPSGAGLLLAIAAGPSLMRWMGERITALFGFAITTSLLLLVGLVDRVTDVIDPVSPVRIVELIGVELSPGVRTAALLAMPLGFGVTLTTTSVQTYINRRVPLAYQGRAFALQGMLKNGVTIVPLLALGAMASAFGVQRILIASPFVLIVLAYLLVQTSLRFSGRANPGRLHVLQSYWHESKTEPAPG